MSEAPIPYAGAVSRDGKDEGIDYCLEVIRERIRYWEHRRKSWIANGFVYDPAMGMVETELVSLKKRILAQRRAGT